LGIVVGSPHFGDSFVKKWGAYIGDGVEVTGGDGEPREYSGVGRQIAAHMTENQVLQAMMRFGRDGGGATVYVHTRAVPSWVPIENAPGVISFRGDDDGRTDGEHGIKQVWRYALENDEFARSDASEAVDVSERTVKRALKELVENGALEKEWSGGRNVYSVADEGYNVAAEVDLTPDRRPWSSLEN
jgi:DNA-binding transcriptional ArsR family regulator